MSQYRRLWGFLSLAIIMAIILVVSLFCIRNMDNATAVSPHSAIFIFTFTVSIVSAIILFVAFLGTLFNALQAYFHHTSWEVHFDMIHPKGKPLGSRITLGLNGSYNITMRLQCRDTTVLSKTYPSFYIGEKQFQPAIVWQSLKLRWANGNLPLPLPSKKAWESLFYPSPATIANCPVQIKSIIYIKIDDTPLEFMPTVSGTRCTLGLKREKIADIGHLIFINMDITTTSKWDGTIEFRSDVRRNEHNEARRISKAIKISKKYT